MKAEIKPKYNGRSCPIYTTNAHNQNEQTLIFLFYFVNTVWRIAPHPIFGSVPQNNRQFCRQLP